MFKAFLLLFSYVKSVSGFGKCLPDLYLVGMQISKTGNNFHGRKLLCTRPFYPQPLHTFSPTWKDSHFRRN